MSISSVAKQTIGRKNRRSINTTQYGHVAQHEVDTQVENYCDELIYILLYLSRKLYELTPFKTIMIQ